MQPAKSDTSIVGDEINCIFCVLSTETVSEGCSVTLLSEVRYSALYERVLLSRTWKLVGSFTQIRRALYLY